jgi:hypothetical protein
MCNWMSNNSFRGLVSGIELLVRERAPGEVDVYLHAGILLGGWTFGRMERPQ